MRVVSCLMEPLFSPAKSHVVHSCANQTAQYNTQTQIPSIIADIIVFPFFIIEGIRLSCLRVRIRHRRSIVSFIKSFFIFIIEYIYFGCGID